MNPTIRKIVLALALALALASSSGFVCAQSAGEFRPSVEAAFEEMYRYAPPEKLYIHTDKPYYCAGDTVWFKGYLTDALTGLASAGSRFIYVELFRGPMLADRIKVRADEYGFCNSLELSPKLTEGVYTLRAYTRWQTNFSPDYFFRRDIEIVNSDTNRTPPPRAGSDFDIQFMPEGGHLIEGYPQRLAFKAVGDDGLGVDVTVRIADSRGEIIAEERSQHLGMGYVTLTPEKAPYTASITTDDGREKRLALPEVHSSGCTVKIQHAAGKIYVQTFLTPDVNPADIGLVIHSAGKLVSAEELRDRQQVRIIPMDKLPRGILHFCLVDKAGKGILSERIFFVRSGGLPEVTVATAKASYGKRSLIEAQIDVRDCDGNPVTGSFSLAVTDDMTVREDEFADNIVSSLLLTSDIRGYVERPGYYFANPSPETDAALDLLMLTQGWRRFDMTQVLRRELPRPRHEHETAQSIRGEIKGFFGNAARKPTLIVYVPRSGTVEVFDLPDGNTFKIDGIEMPDSISLVLQAVNRGGKFVPYVLNIHKPSYPAGDSPAPYSYRRPEDRMPDGFIIQTRERLTLDRNIKHIDIEGITYTGVRQPKSLPKGASSSYSLDSKRIESLRASSMMDLFRHIPGLDVGVNSVTIRGQGQHVTNSDGAVETDDMPVFFVGDVVVDLAFVEAMNVDNVARIDIVKGNDALLAGDGGQRGAILITEKVPGDSKGGPAKSSVAYVREIGWKSPRDFYQPRYDTSQAAASRIPDLRNTLLWNPRIRTDSTGRARVNFYSADRATRYRFVVEGLSDGGEPCRGEYRIEIK